MAGLSLYRGDREIVGNHEHTWKTRENLYIFFLRVLGARRHPRDFPEPVGSILCEYGPKLSHMDLFRINCHDFLLKKCILKSAQPIYLLYRDDISLQVLMRAEPRS